MMNEDWIEVELGEVCFTTSGGTPSRNNRGFYQGTIPWVKSGELDKGIIYDTEEHISEEAVKKSSAKIFPEGSLLIALYGATIGKLAFLGVKASTNQAICGIYKNEFIESKYLYNFLLNRKQKLISQGTGGAQPNISQTILKKLEIPLAPLPIQRAIVSKLEALFSDLDNGIAQLKTAQAQLKIYRQAVLKKAFEGALTKEWREKQTHLPTADALLKQIKEERQNHYNQQIEDWKKAVKEWEKDEKKDSKPSKPSALKELPPLKKEELEELSILPVGWAWCRIADVGSVETGATPKRGNSDYWENGNIAWITSGALNDDFVKECKEYVTEKALKETNIKVFPKHSLVMAMYGEGKTRGKSSELLIETATNQAIACIVQKNKEGETRKYLKSFLVKIYQDIRRKSSGGVQPNINLDIVKNLNFPLCSIAEQAQIVAEIESRLSVCDKMAQSLTESVAKAEALRQSILKRAFEGKLLSAAEIAQCQQAADYEPAGVLLERIKAEKLAKEKKTSSIKNKAQLGF